ncbi:hypothetical protein A3A79_04830 [Candidatus Gottesmanbacteria bacterium RIFCSPLOWO2_01_FULL_43_11b]|uniref:Uncharacterized protein n=1 Tax=Candidatus Gottesmanbacteria bacterium RIFCSPLOWO2_01_FULL_43_11b TaxID=1798392 RepID=A0A1F6AID2_9BACT|nr:MAG: hypothetical protein A3A79_04830 [Candidatus Gottesmanbacteria bacterium RIFCSPLOWO2_01_FULL_43_11b]
MLLPRIITLSGVDGSGKSTIAALLKDHFKKQGHSAHVAHIGAGVGGVSISIGSLIYLKDYIQIIFQYMRSIGKYDIIIFDRFLYDTLVKISHKQQSRLPRFFAFPIAHIAFHLRLSDKISYTRDKEHSKEYHGKKHEFYNEVAKHFHLIPIDAERPKNMVLEEIINHLKN